MRHAHLFISFFVLTACGSEETENEKGSGGASHSECQAQTAAGFRDCVDTQKLKDDLTFIAQPRQPGSAHWQAVQDLCADRFQKYGFEVERHQYATGVNVIGKLTGTSKAAEQVLVSAHYDHIPACKGADDNATGVAAVLETARILGKRSFERTLTLACWDEEERGLVGAFAYAERAKKRNETITAMYSLEMIGYKTTAPNTQQVPTGFNVLFADAYKKVEDNQFRGDFVAIVALESSKPIVQKIQAHADAVGLSSVLLALTKDQASSPLLNDLKRSDHAAFWFHGFPGVMITDTSNFRYQQYHCGSGEDEVSLLDMEFLTQVTQAQLGAQVETLGLVK